MMNENQNGKSTKKYGIENLIKLVTLAVAVQKWYKEANADKKIELQEYMTGLLTAMPIADAYKNRGKILKEIGDLDYDEVNQIVDAVDGANKGNVVHLVSGSLHFLAGVEEVVNAL